MVNNQKVYLICNQPLFMDEKKGLSSNVTVHICHHSSTALVTFYQIFYKSVMYCHSVPFAILLDQ